ncbi:type III secretion system cytoplasmic ring protein SctQ [Hahella ganghwensis]|uniref:type III secretion system cytoplasmic ring protein SctQ n=1 Tax=Hahella ganghwensis TaxID=286420 RepID=UPI000382C31D|nr:type III secretion system cytoplasmic ring protein SctQ [Hahella ganghwensis]
MTVDHNGFQTELDTGPVEVRSLRPELPSIPETQILQTNILHSRGIFARVCVSSQLSHWRFQHERKQPRHWIKMRAAEKHLWLALDSDQWNVSVNDRHWTQFQPCHQALAFTLAHKEFLDHLEELTGIVWQVEEISSHESFPPENSIPLRFMVENRNQLTNGIINLCLPTLSMLTKRPVWERTSLPSQRFLEKVPVPVHIQTHAFSLRLSELQTYGPGDVMLIGPESNVLNTLLLVHSHSNTPLWNLKKAGDSCSLLTKTSTMKGHHLSAHENHEDTIKEVISMNPESPSQTSTAQDSASETTNEQSHYKVQDLPIDINVQVGKLTLSVDELNQLEPGHTLKIPSEDHSREAILLANGHPIGRGELVIVGDQLGIRITELG